MSFIVLKSGNEKHRQKEGDKILNRSAILSVRLCIDEDDKETGEYVAIFETDESIFPITFDCSESLKTFLKEKLGDLLPAHKLDDLVIRQNPNNKRKEQFEKALEGLKSALGA